MNGKRTRESERSVGIANNISFSLEVFHNQIENPKPERLMTAIQFCISHFELTFENHFSNMPAF
jgi:hypothetical protein